MTRQFCFLVTAILSSQLRETCNSFRIDPGRSWACSRQRTVLGASPPETNGETPKPERKSRPGYMRCADYPMFAYDDPRRPTTRRVSVKPKNDTADRTLFGLVPPSIIESDFLVSGVRDSNRRTRLLNRRSYAAQEPFEQKNINEVRLSYSGYRRDKSWKEMTSYLALLLAHFIL